MRHAFRSLFKSPGFTAVALLTLALGIGANSTAFSVLNALLLHTPPYPESHRVVRLYRTTPQGLGSAHAPANFLDYRAQNTVFEHLAVVQSTDVNLGEPGQPADRLRGQLVTPDFFPLIRIAPALGRTFLPDEDQPGRNNVIVLSHGTWTQRFGADPAILGRTVRLDGEPVTIVGVMPASADDPQIWGEVGLWRPIAMSDKTRADRDNTFLAVVGRLKPGVDLASAGTAMTALAARLAEAYPEFNSDRGLRLVPLGETTTDATGRRITWLVAGLAGFVLLIACANLANLQFARNAARGREHAIRAALGATRAQLMRLVLAESLLLSLVGGALGLVLALWTNDLVGRSFSFGERNGLDVSLDHRVLGFTFAVSVLTGITFGLFPAWLASRAHVGDALKQGARGSTGGRAQQRVRHALIVFEVALALVLLLGASLFFGGLHRFTQRDPGWQPDNLISAYVSLRGPNYSTNESRAEFFRRLQDRIATLPGIEHVGIGTSLPTWGFSNANTFVVEGRPPPPPGNSPQARVTGVLPGYFETLGIRLLQGRDFTADDSERKPLVVVINESMARQLWPGENPIGKRIGGATPYLNTPREVIGVVSDVRAVGNLDNVEGRFQFYRALTQWGRDFATIAVRTQLAPETVERDLRRVVAEIDPDQAIYRVAPLRQEITRSLGSIDAAAYALVGFALLGMALAAIGIYGVISHSVVQRTNEIGVRLALGAQVRDILALILSGGLRLTLLGAALGLIGAWFVARLLRAISPEFTTTSPLVAATITLTLLLVGLLACYLPARRATKVDPITALRAE